MTTKITMNAAITTLLTDSKAYGMTVADIATELGKTEASVRRRLTDLKRQGIAAVHTAPQDTEYLHGNARVWVLQENLTQAA